MGEAPSAVAMSTEKAAPAPVARRDRRPSAELDRESGVGARAEPQRCANFTGSNLLRAVRPTTRIDGFSTVSPRADRERACGADSAATERRAGPATGGGPRSLETGWRTHDVCHALQRVIDHHRQMIARRQVAAAQDNVAPDVRRRPNLRWNRRPRHIRSSSAPVRRRLRAACRAGTPPCRRARPGLALRPETKRGTFRDKAARHLDRADHSSPARSPTGCKNKGRRDRAGGGARAPPRSRRRARSAGVAQES